MLCEDFGFAFHALSKINALVSRWWSGKSLENLEKNFPKQSIKLQKPLNIFKPLLKPIKQTFLNLGDQGADIQAGWGSLEQTIQYPGGELFPSSSQRNFYPQWISRNEICVICDICDTQNISTEDIYYNTYGYTI